MHVALLSVYAHPNCTLKDVAGGFGTAFEVGSSWRARMLEAAKGRVARLPPLVLGYLSAQLREAGHRVTVHERRDERRALPEADMVILLSSMVDASAERAALKELRATGCRRVVIGAFASARPEHYEDVAEAVIIGESEVLGAGLCDPSLLGAVKVGDVPDLDQLPFPDWHPFPVESYRYAFLSWRSATLPIASARGCAYGCSYCPWRVSASFRQRDPARVAEEIRQMGARFGVRTFSFRDPLFNLDRDRVVELARLLTPLGIRFSAEMRADRLDDELLSKLAAAGLRSLEIGVETVDRDLLGKTHRKPPEHAQVHAVVKGAQSKGVRVICNYMLGLPSDDESKIRQTVAWAKQLDSFAVQFTIATPYPGTSLETEVKGRRLPLAPDDHTGFRSTFRHPKISASRLAELREWAYVSYHFRPRYGLRFARHALPTLWER